MSHNAGNASGDLTAQTDRQQTVMADQGSYRFIDAEPIGTVHHPQAGPRSDLESSECSRRLSLPAQHQVEDDSSIQKRHGSDPRC